MSIADEALSGDAQLVESLFQILRIGDRRTAKSLAVELGMDRSLINSVLYSCRQVFKKQGDSPPVWSVRNTRATTASAASSRVVVRRRSISQPGPVAAIDLTQLYEWQKEALEAWRNNRRQGIVEAVTGAGKTRLGLVAASEALGRQEKVAVIVPKIELAAQWRANLCAALPTARIGQMGGGEADTLGNCDVLVAVGASAGKKDLGLGAQGGLLIADECHRYAAEQARRALEDGFSSRLGLSATYERSDGLHEEVLLPYFHRVVYQLGYRRALDDGVVARFRVALLPVLLNSGERFEYDALSEDLRKAKRTLVTRFGVPSEPYEEFMAALARIRRSGGMQEGIAANRYWGAMKRRRALLAETPAKLTVIGRVVDAIRDADRAIVFTESIEGAEQANATLHRLGVRSDVLHSQLAADERQGALRDFAAGGLNAIVAPTLLDEGVDVPEADVAVILAASQQRRQMIQRMGRILRVKKDGRQARFVIAYVVDTSEDPANGAHEAFLSEILDVADDVRHFTAGTTASEVRAYLAPLSAPKAPTAPTPTVPQKPASAPPPVTFTEKLSRAQRTTVVAARLGLTEDQLLEYRRTRATVLLGTKGMSCVDRIHRIAGATGLAVDVAERWDEVELALSRQ